MNLVYTTTEFCAPVLRNSCHSKLIDVKINHTMRIISGTIKSTPTVWFPVLCNIAPPELRRNQATAKLLFKIKANKNSLLYFELLDLPVNRLRSRHPIWNDFQELERFNLIDKWREKWFSEKVCNYELITDPTVIVGGFSLERGEWSLLNRFGTGFGCSVMTI